MDTYLQLLFHRIGWYEGRCELGCPEQHVIRYFIERAKRYVQSR